MAGTGAGYDLSPTTFSPDGRVYQVEYAMKAVENSGTAMAICCTDGIIFAVEKFLVSKMLVPGTAKRIYPVDRTTGMAVGGMVADARQLVARGRSEVTNWKNAYDEQMPPEVLADRIGLFVHAYTLYGAVRPFGCTVLMGCVDKDTKEPSLFTIEPSGVVFKYKGTATGKGAMAAKTEIEKLMAAPITCEEALPQVAKILYKVHDEKDRDFELEMSWICPGSRYQFSAVPPAILKEAEDKAKKALEDEDQDD